MFARLDILLLVCEHPTRHSHSSAIILPMAPKSWATFETAMTQPQHVDYQVWVGNVPHDMSEQIFRAFWWAMWWPTIIKITLAPGNTNPPSQFAVVTLSTVKEANDLKAIRRPGAWPNGKHIFFRHPHSPLFFWTGL